MYACYRISKTAYSQVPLVKCWKRRWKDTRYACENGTKPGGHREAERRITCWNPSVTKETTEPGGHQQAEPKITSRNPWLECSRCFAKTCTILSQLFLFTQILCHESSQYNTFRMKSLIENCVIWLFLFYLDNCFLDGDDPSVMSLLSGGGPLLM